MVEKESFFPTAAAARLTAQWWAVGARIDAGENGTDNAQLTGPPATMKKKRLKIRLDASLDSSNRVVFDDEGNPVSPFERLVQDWKNERLRVEEYDNVLSALLLLLLLLLW